MPAPSLASVLAPLVVAGADAGANLLIHNQDEIANVLRTYETTGVDALEADLLAAIPRQSFSEKIAYGEITATIKNLANEIIAQLPSENVALVNVLVNGLASISAKAAGEN